MICLESDNESELDVHLITTKKSGTDIIASASNENSQVHLISQRVEAAKVSGIIQDCFPMDDLVLDNYNNNDKDLMKHGRDGIMDDNIGITYERYIENQDHCLVILVYKFFYLFLRDLQFHTN